MQELSLHILDLLLNSVEANASLVKLEIIENPADDFFMVIIEDNGFGMDENTLRRATDPFFTTSKDKNVGLGLALFKAKAESCDGYLSINSNKGKGTTVKALFKYNHLDRPPLGNIAGSICGFLLAEKDIDLYYLHQVNFKNFIFDTRLIKKKVHPLNISHPAIINWIREYIKTSLKDIGSKG